MCILPSDIGDVRGGSTVVVARASVFDNWRSPGGV